MRFGTRDGLCALLLAGAFMIEPAAAQEAEREPEQVVEAELARRGAGLRAGVWSLDLPDEVEDQDASEWPYVEGYFQRGMDRHLAIESTLGLQRRTIQETTTTGGGLLNPGETSTREVTTYVVPLMTALKLYPFTGPESRFEPFIAAGGGFAFGIEDVEDGGTLGGGGTGVLTGFGLKGEVGVEWRFSSAFGLAARAGYQWIRFGDDFGGVDTYKGPGAALGLTYRFQY